MRKELKKHETKYIHINKKILYVFAPLFILVPIRTVN